MNTQVEQIKAEIERRIKSVKICPFKTAELGSEKETEGLLKAYNDILSVINNLPDDCKTEELEQEIARVWDDLGDDFIYQLHWEEFRESAIHFANWQRERMMKEAVELGETTIYWENDNGRAFPNINPTAADLMLPSVIASRFNDGDKVKLLIIKAED